MINSIEELEQRGPQAGDVVLFNGNYVEIEKLSDETVTVDNNAVGPLSTLRPFENIVHGGSEAVPKFHWIILEVSQFTRESLSL